MDTETLIALHRDLARDALPLWGIPASTRITLLNFSENTTFRIHNPQGTDYVLRLHRLGYHTRDNIASELAWIEALAAENVLHTAKIHAGLDGETIQRHATANLPAHFLVLFAFLRGSEPHPDENLEAAFTMLGSLAARTHLQSMKWQKPAFFARHRWDTETVFGEKPLWGHWRDGPNMTQSVIHTLDTAERLIIQQLEQYGENTNNFGLIHADMRLANLLVDGETTHVIDFDDCGFSWWMYDFAAAISFHETHPQIPALKQAWLQGYQAHRPLKDADIQIIDTLVMLRRLQLLGWLGSHHDNLVAPALAPHFGQETYSLVLKWIDSHPAPLL